MTGFTVMLLIDLNRSEPMAYEGTCHIIEKDLWGEDYCNIEVQAFIRVGSNGMGDFQFALVSGGIEEKSSRRVMRND
ncbi:MAG: hypothetical protein PVF74_04020 [Anaerolineales bacterium]